MSEVQASGDRVSWRGVVATSATLPNWPNQYWSGPTWKDRCFRSFGVRFERIFHYGGASNQNWGDSAPSPRIRLISLQAS